MQSLGMGLLKRLLVEQKNPSVLNEEYCVTADCFQEGEELRTFEYIYNHFVNYGQTPALLTVEKECGVSFSKLADEPMGYWANSIVKRKQSLTLLELSKAISGKVSTYDVDGAIEVARSTLFKIGETKSSDRLFTLGELGQPAIEKHNKRQRSSRISGIPFGIPYVDEVSDGAQSGDAIAFVGSSGVGKCIPEGTLIPTSSGISYPIEDCLKHEIISWIPKTGELSYDYPKAIIKAGKLDCKKLTLNNGLSIILSNDHRIFSGEKCGEIEVKDIVVGNHIAVPTTLPEPKHSIKYDEEAIIINAFLSADGSTTSRKSTYTKSDLKLINILSECLEKYGFFLRQRGADKDTDWTIEDKYGVSGGKVMDFLSSIGVQRCKSIDKTIPDFVFKLPNELLRIWLGAFYSCDGSKGEDIDLTLSSKKMLYQYRELLLRFGVYGKIFHREIKLKGKKFDAWRLIVSGKYRQKFVDAIPIYSSKPLMPHKNKYNNDKIPNFGWLLDIIDYRVSPYGKFITKLGNAYISKSRIMSRCNNGNHVVRGLLEKAGVERGFTNEIKWMETVEFAEVVKIENVGKLNCYDLQMPNSPWFVCGQTFVHNSYFIFNSALYAFTQGYRTFVVPTEMAIPQTAARFQAMYAHVSPTLLKHGRLSYFGMKRFREKIVELETSENQIYFMESGVYTTIESIAMRIQEVKPHIVYIDGGYLLHHGQKGNEKRWERVATIAEIIKTMAKEFNIPFIVSYQYNAKGPGLGNIGGSIAISQLASIVFSIENENDTPQSNLGQISYKILKLIKGRDGESGSVRMEYNMEKASITQESVIQGNRGNYDN